MSLTPAEGDRDGRGEPMFPPAVWVCPTCGNKVRTHIPTFQVTCRNRTHYKDVVKMEASNVQ
jgi:hypothetical protein